MPRLACWSCGRQIYTPSPVDSLFSEERRCPRCGAFLNTERREADRRIQVRRQNPPNEPGPIVNTGVARRFAWLGLQPAATNAATPARAIDRNRRRAHSVLTSRA